MSRLFISHSASNNAAAIALRDWLAQQGFDDVFLDIDPNRGLTPGERWQEALKAAADRCEAVLFLVSPAWLESRWCLAEFLLAKSLHKRIFGLIIAPASIDRLPVEMTAEWQLCELVGEGRSRTFEFEVFGKTERITFREAGLELLRRGLDRAGLDARSFPWPPGGEPSRAPYRGLKALESKDAAIFFGRDAAIVRGIDRVRGLVEGGVEKILIVLGASGSGKSSFLQAGLWPRLARDDANFLVLPVIRPLTAVITGSSGLAASLATAFERLGAQRSLGRIKETLAVGGGEAFGACLDDLSTFSKQRLVVTGEVQADPAIILPLDQAEELFNPDGLGEAEAFLDLLARVLVSAPGIRAHRMLVVATMRSDRFELLQNEPRLAGVKRALIDLPAIPQTEFKSVIEGPTRRVVEAGGRLVIDPALSERLIADAQGADALPLLGFTLERLYADYGSGGRLTVAEYDKLGGVQGSIGAAVANALREPGRSPAIPVERETQFAALRAAFIPWLARVNPETGVPMRRVARHDEIPEGSRSIVERLVDARLLIADRRGGVDVIEIAHESLLRQWSALTAWLDADAADLKLAEEIERAAGEWVRNGRLEGWLDHRSDRLRAAELLLARGDFRLRLGEEGAAYLAACRAREEAERKEREQALARTARLQRRIGWGLTGFAVVVVAGLAIGWWQRHANLVLQGSLSERQTQLDEESQANRRLQTNLDARQQALDEAHANLLAELAAIDRAEGNWDGALRYAVHGARLGLELDQRTNQVAAPRAELAAAVSQARWQLVLNGHEDYVQFAAFSPDGSRIVTAASDRTARIWDARTGRELLILRGHESFVASAAFSPDGQRIVTASGDMTARIWDSKTGKEISVLRGHEDEVVAAAFSRDGRRIVTASSDKTARIWDAATATQIAVLHGHEDRVTSTAFSPDGARIVTGSQDKTARIWDAVTAKQSKILRGHGWWVESAAFSPDGLHIVTASDDNTARIWDAATAKQIAVLQAPDVRVTAAAYSPDGSRIVTALWDKTARIWDVQTAKEIAVLRGHEGSLQWAAFSPDGLRIVTASLDKTARIWNTGAEAQLFVLRGHLAGVETAAFSQDGSRVITAGDHTARIWDAATAREIAVLRGHTRIVRSAAFSADGSRIVTASDDKTARIWDAQTAEELAVLSGHEDRLTSAAFSPDGSRIVTSSWDKTARIWDVQTAKELAVLSGHENRLNSAAFSPDGSRIVTSAFDRTARIWDAATGKQIAILSGHETLVTDAAFNPDGSRIVTASGDSTARIWDAATGEQTAVLHGHSYMVSSAVFNADGSRIVTSSWDNTARVWDVATARQIVLLQGHEDKLMSAAFSPDGSRVVTAAFDKTARIWDVRFATMPTQGLVGEACARRLGSLTKLNLNEMRRAGYPDTMPEIDVCEAAE